MGSDGGPEITVAGALTALEADPSLHISLHGSLPNLEKYLPAKTLDRLKLVASSSVVGMQDSTAEALRGKTDSSMSSALESLRSGQVDAVISAGNTAALVAFGVQKLGTLPGIERPALCTAVPNPRGCTWMLDMGAILEPGAVQLQQMAIMGACQARFYDRTARPRVGLLNVGAELNKGKPLIREAARLLQEIKTINYLGFAEGTDLFSGKFDLIVCDGFSGNIALKAAEGASGYIAGLLGEELASGNFNRLLSFLLRPALRNWAARVDPDEYNGASMLGLNGLVVKSHGAAGSHGFFRAIRLAAELARAELVRHLAEELDSLNRHSSNKSGL